MAAKKRHFSMLDYRWIILSLALIALSLGTNKTWPSAAKIMPPSGEFLTPFLVPRTPGSEGARRLRSWLQEVFIQQLGWNCEEDAFVETVLGGQSLTFTNLICQPPRLSKPYLVLSAHLDSKWRVTGVPDGEFIGATDSAWSCSLLLELARQGVQAQIIFFDGEEAFGEWTATDSLYGSRHLASRWKGEDRLKDIKLLVLFDLLGAARPQIYNLGEGDRPAFSQLLRVQSQLRPQLRTPPIFLPHQRMEIQVQDDHEPFAKLGVPHVHLIPIPFPSVWHTPADNVTSLHADTIHDLHLVISRWVKLIQ